MIDNTVNASSINTNSIFISDINLVLLGKQSKAFSAYAKQPQHSNFLASQCLTLQTVHSVELNVIAESTELLSAFMFGLQHIFHSNAKEVILDTHEQSVPGTAKTEERRRFTVEHMKKSPSSASLASLASSGTSSATPSATIPDNSYVNSMAEGCTVYLYQVHEEDGSVTKKEQLLWYEASLHSSLGSICWCDPPNANDLVLSSATSQRVHSASRTFHLRELSDVYVGKSSKVFESHAAKSVLSSHCMTLISSVHELNIEMRLRDHVAVWVEGLKHILQHTGRRIAEEDTYVADDQADNAAAAAADASPSPSPSSSATASPLTPSKRTRRISVLPAVGASTTTSSAAAPAGSTLTVPSHLPAAGGAASASSSHSSPVGSRRGSFLSLSNYETLKMLSKPARFYLYESIVDEQKNSTNVVKSIYLFYKADVNSLGVGNLHWVSTSDLTEEQQRKMTALLSQAATLSTADINAQVTDIVPAATAATAAEQMLSLRDIVEFDIGKTSPLFHPTHATHVADGMKTFSLLTSKGRGGRPAKGLHLEAHDMETFSAWIVSLQSLLSLAGKKLEHESSSPSASASPSASSAPADGVATAYGAMTPATAAGNTAIEPLAEEEEMIAELQADLLADHELSEEERLSLAQQTAQNRRFSVRNHEVSNQQALPEIIETGDYDDDEE